jgi:hypothetical protein
MSRKLALLALTLLLSSSLFARTRAVAPAGHPEVRHEGGAVTGVVDSVSGTLIHLAGGLVTIDASGAKILMGRGEERAVADIESGMLLVATVRRGAIAAGEPIPASMIVVTRQADVSFAGSVESVNVAGQTLTIFGRTIHVTSSTSFGGFRASGLQDVTVNQLVQVEADAVGGILVARSVLVAAPAMPNVNATRGIVRSISSDTWIIERARGEQMSLVIDANTRIAGSPKVGDTVEVLYRVDASHANIAIAIARIELTVPVLPSFDHVIGTVQTIGATAWVIRKTEGGDVTVGITRATLIAPGIRIGDSVDALVERRRDGSLVAVMITARR